MPRVGGKRLHRRRTGARLQRIARQVQLARLELTRLERTSVPATRPLGRARRGVPLHPHAQLGRVEYAAIPIVQPVIPPPHRFLQKADGRPGPTSIRILVRPRTDDAATRHVEPVQNGYDGVGVSVGPTTDHQHGTTNRRVVFADRTVPPIRIALRMCHPGFDERGRAVEPSLPQFAPCVRRPLADPAASR